ncbi:MAG: hypothetical protein ABIF06_01445 [bacterium]
MSKIDHFPRYGLLILFFVVVVGYSVFQARFLIIGPQLKITSPSDGISIETPIIVIEGTAKNISWISLNDQKIFTDEEGRWSEKLIVSEGLSIMTVKVRDRFGRETEKQVRIFLN